MSEQRLHIVVGKGGVGKSTVSAAIALALQRAGARVLAIEVDEPGGLSRLFEARAPRAGQIIDTPSGVALAWFEGGAALAEYLERIVHLGPALEPVLAHPFYRAFVTAAPGLSELMVIGKVRDELMLHKVHGRRRWDALVLDAGATGHALELLRMPAVAAMTFRSGGAHREASNVQAFLRDPSRTRVHVVAKPEELACAEASDLVVQVTGELGMSIGSLVVNACRPTPPARIDDALDALAASADDGPRRQVCGDLIDVVAHALGWQRRQASAIQRLVARTGVSALELPLLSGPLFGLPELRLLSRRLEEVVR